MDDPCLTYEEREVLGLDRIVDYREVYGDSLITGDKILSHSGGKFLPNAPDIATYHPTRKGWYVTAAGETLKEWQIKASGHTIIGTKPPEWDRLADKAKQPAPQQTPNGAEGGIVQKATAAASKREKTLAEYREAILALPEAKERPKTAEKLLAAYTPHSMPVHMAKTFLAGLPVESAQPEEASTPMSTHAENMIIRATELHANVLMTKGARGCMKSKADAKALRYALQVKSFTPNASIIHLLETSGADLEPIRAMLRKANASASAR